MSLARYTGQSRKLRELAVEKLGAEKVACMSDEEVTSFVDSEYAIFWGDCTDGFAGHGPETTRSGNSARAAQSCSWSGDGHGAQGGMPRRPRPGAALRGRLLDGVERLLGVPPAG